MAGMAGMAGMAMAEPLSPPEIAAAFLMWALMMVAMMLPSALPMILLYARLAHRASAMLAFALAYILVWTGASLIAAMAQQGLIAADILDSRLILGHPLLAGALLIAAGLYQFSPLKRRCLDRCRSPLSFLISGWRPGMAGAIHLGLRHGLYCLGCCWLLMALLLVGGVMNLAWVALLAAIVLAEKIAPGGRWTATGVGGVALLAGFAAAGRGLALW